MMLMMVVIDDDDDVNDDRCGGALQQVDPAHDRRVGRRVREVS